MKKTKIIFAIAVMTLFPSCEKFLDVKPKGEKVNMFETAEEYEDALYGVYSELSTTESLYDEFFLLAPEAMSQNFTSFSDYRYGNLALADWETNGPVLMRGNMWSSAYEAINHINNIVLHCEENPDEYEYSRLYYGEALALRALVHFDLARFFGAPIWASASEKAQCIPYVTEYGFTITDFSSLDEVFAKVLEDLQTAETLLAQDEELMPATRDNVADGFTSCRILHMNLYAVQALMARVYWTMDDLENAAVYAQKIIDSGKFSLRPASSFVQPDNGTMDLNETIFGFYTNDQSSQSIQLGLSGTSSTAFDLATDFEDLYESTGATADYRLSAWFDISIPMLTKTVSSVFYGTSTSYTGKSILGYNILRLPEMYYIMAERYMDSDNARATEYFDTVLASRGREKFADLGQELTYDDLFDERRREFYGEGFTWHEMKKLGMDINVNGIILSGQYTDTYTFPVPDDEWEARNNLEE